jgi:YidC/Oxa1 family membrane protein insertase
MSAYLGNSFGLAIIALTVIVNLAMLPLTLSQLRSSKALQDMQPKLAEIQKKYAKDRQKMSQEQMRLYKESGVKPAGCAVTTLIQMPVWFAVYQAVMLVLAVTPEGLLNLSRFLYPWDSVFASVPANAHFLWLNLSGPDTILALLVGATMWVQQKMTTPVTTDPRQQSQTQMMLWMMPLMFAFLALSFPSGLALYWVVSSLVRIAMQYKVTGWGGLTRRAVPEADKDKKYVKFNNTVQEKTGADIVVSGDQLKKSGEDKSRKNREPRQRKQ